MKSAARAEDVWVSSRKSTFVIFGNWQGVTSLLKPAFWTQKLGSLKFFQKSLHSTLKFYMFMFLMSITKYTFSDSQPSSIFRIDDMEIIHGHSYVFDNKSAKNIVLFIFILWFILIN